MNKSEFLKHLRDLVGEGRTEEALNLLFTQTKDFAAYFSNDIIMLKSQFISAKNQFLLKNIIENTEFGRITVKVNLAILEIADKIETQTESHETKRKGHLLHKIPSNMVKEKETKCIIRIAYFLEQLLVGLTIDEDTIFQTIQVTGLMSVELLDDNETKTFEIRTSTDEEQFIILEDFTQWIFKVRPLRIGCFPLLLKIGVVEVINGKERKRNIIIEKEIKITVNDLKANEEGFSFISIEDENFIKKVNDEKEKREQALQEIQKSDIKANSKDDFTIKSDRERTLVDAIVTGNSDERSYVVVDKNGNELHIKANNQEQLAEHLRREREMDRPSMSSRRMAYPSCLRIILMILIIVVILYFVFKR